jgi:hypothetical protein
MPVFFSEDFPQTSMPELREIVEPGGLALAGATLGELLRHLEAAQDIRVVPDPDAGKYFRYHNPAAGARFDLVDVHIERDGVELCPKQDLSFPLLPSDRVNAGMLIC